jgi:hypothetical protein
VLCGKPIKDEATTKIIEEIDGTSYMFDRKECALILKKFRSVYGSDFLAGIIS